MRRLAVLLGGFLIFFIVFFSVHNLFQARRPSLISFPSNRGRV